jgi:hypothetical protein
MCAPWLASTQKPEAPTARSGLPKRREAVVAGGVGVALEVVTDAGGDVMDIELTRKRRSV